MSVRLFVENYRGLRKIDWELPKGVCALAGPNGSGKTTLLDVPAILRDMLANGVWQGLSLHGTNEGLRNLHAGHTDHVNLGMLLEPIDWQLDFLIDEASGSQTYGEVIRDQQVVVVDRKHGEKSFSYGGRDVGGDAAFRHFAYDKYATGPGGARLLPPFSLLADYRLYRPYDLDHIRSTGSDDRAGSVLFTSGHNVFSVLRNWRDRRATKDRYDFVVESLKDAFPDIFEELELESSAGGMTGRVFGPRSRESLPILHAPNGLLTGLLHVVAVASTQPGGVVAIDEPENGLHPHATQRLLNAMREWADLKELTVLLATHSTVLLDQFKEEPEHLFVLEPGQEVLPVRLDQVRNREWLAQFSLGDLYKAGDFGAPLEGAA